MMISVKVPFAYLAVRLEGDYPFGGVASLGPIQLNDKVAYLCGSQVGRNGTGLQRHELHALRPVTAIDNAITLIKRADSGKIGIVWLQKIIVYPSVFISCQTDKMLIIDFAKIRAFRNLDFVRSGPFAGHPAEVHLVAARRIGHELGGRIVVVYLIGKSDFGDE